MPVTYNSRERSAYMVHCSIRTGSVHWVGKTNDITAACAFCLAGITSARGCRRIYLL